MIIALAWLAWPTDIPECGGCTPFHSNFVNASLKVTCGSPKNLFRDQRDCNGRVR
jgi:hypothetical protein